MKIDAKAYKASWDTYVEQSFDVALTTGDILRLALEAYEAAKPQPAAPEVVAWPEYRYRNKKGGAWTQWLKMAVPVMSWRYVIETRHAPPPAPQGDVAEAVAKEREACALECEEAADFLLEVVRTSIAPLLDLQKAQAGAHALRTVATVIRARAEQKADRA